MSRQVRVSGAVAILALLGASCPGWALFPGDANGDRIVNDLDLAALAVNWQQSGKVWAQGDFNGDGLVNDLDFAAIAVNWGKTFNQFPAAGDDSYETGTNTTLTVAAPGVLENDTDPEDDPLTAIKVTDPSHGTLALNSDGSFEYIPDTDYTGPDSFTYKAYDG